MPKQFSSSQHVHFKMQRLPRGGGGTHVCSPGPVYKRALPYAGSMLPCCITWFHADRISLYQREASPRPYILRSKDRGARTYTVVVSAVVVDLPVRAPAPQTTSCIQWGLNFFVLDSRRGLHPAAPEGVCRDVNHISNPDVWRHSVAMVCTYGSAGVRAR